MKGWLKTHWFYWIYHRENPANCQPEILSKNRKCLAPRRCKAPWQLVGLYQDDKISEILKISEIWHAVYSTTHG